MRARRFPSWLQCREAAEAAEAAAGAGDDVTGKKHFVDIGLVVDIEDGTVRLSANADVVLLLED